jgi:hypothetical protein
MDWDGVIGPVALSLNIVEIARVCKIQPVFATTSGGDRGRQAGGRKPCR